MLMLKEMSNRYLKTCFHPSGLWLLNSKPLPRITSMLSTYDECSTSDLFLLNIDGALMNLDTPDGCGLLSVKHDAMAN